MAANSSSTISTLDWMKDTFELRFVRHRLRLGAQRRFGGQTDYKIIVLQYFIICLPSKTTIEAVSAASAMLPS
ncbi:MAG: hypothetical protein AAGI49_20430, partial [Bacteroidota bacterium]